MDKWRYEFYTPHSILEKQKLENEFKNFYQNSKGTMKNQGNNMKSMKQLNSFESQANYKK